MLIASLFSFSFLASVALASSLRIRLEQLDIAHGELKTFFKSQLSRSSDLIENSEKYFDKLRECTAANGGSTSKSDRAEIREKLEKHGSKVKECIIEECKSSKNLRNNFLARLKEFQDLAEVIIFSSDEKPSKIAASSSRSASSASITNSMASVSLSNLRAEKPAKYVYVPPSQPPARAHTSERDPFLHSIVSNPNARPSLRGYVDIYHQLKGLSRRERKARLPELVQNYLFESANLARSELPDLSELNFDSYDFLFESLNAQATEIQVLLEK